MAEILKVEGLGKTFGSGRLAVEALKDINLTVNAGDLVALLGPSGSGKTTLLLSVSLILEPTGGKIWLDGETIYDHGWKEVDIRQLRLTKVGFIFQSRNLIPFLTALENVLLPLDLLGLERNEAHRRAMELLEYMEIAERAHYLPALLSGGEQQRVAIARALASAPKLVLADEPTGALDSVRGKKVMEMLKKIARENQTAVICVTHDERMIEGFDYIYRLKDGQLSLSNNHG
jgi:putative ABC transport system ATP-binding protein